MKTWLVITFVLSPLITLAQQSQGSGKTWLLSKSSEGRAAKRFTLHEWLENKDRRALMDMWLSLNTPSPYEIVIGASQLNYEKSDLLSTPVTESISNYEIEFSAYAQLVGITANYQNNLDENFNDLSGQFNLRVFGHTVQGSHITLHYGLRTRTEASGLYRLNQQFAGATLQIYLMKYFGMYGNYKYYLPYSESYYGDTLTDELNTGLFIEFGLMRVFGNFYNERQNSKLNSIDRNIDRKGTKVGIQLYY